MGHVGMQPGPTALSWAANMLCDVYGNESGMVLGVISLLCVLIDIVEENPERVTIAACTQAFYHIGPGY